MFGKRCFPDSNTFSACTELLSLSALQEACASFLRASKRADVALQNAGGVRTAIVAGTITMNTAFTVLPFTNVLVELEVTGAQIVAALAAPYNLQGPPAGFSGSGSVRTVQGQSVRIDAGEKVPPEQVKDKMIALDARRKELEAQIAQADAAPAPVRLHPKMSETYRERVAALIRGLAASEGMEEAREAIRGLIEKIVLTPESTAPNGHSIELFGELGAILTLCGDADGTNAKARRGSAGFRQVTMVAGAGFEPAAFRL